MVSKMKGKQLELHGMSNTRLYHIWENMKSRCSNKNTPNYQYYGAVGISVCDEWAGSFIAFQKWAEASGYSDKLTIDREENKKGYYPDNCRWATQQAQVYNRRTPKHNKSGFRGVHHCNKAKAWVSKVCTGGKVYYSGNFNNPLQAAFRRDKMIIDKGLPNTLTFVWE